MAAVLDSDKMPPDVFSNQGVGDSDLRHQLDGRHGERSISFAFRVSEYLSLFDGRHVLALP